MVLCFPTLQYDASSIENEKLMKMKIMIMMKKMKIKIMMKVYDRGV